MKWLFAFLLFPLVALGQVPQPIMQDLLAIASAPSAGGTTTYAPPTSGLVARYRATDMWINSNGATTNQWPDSVGRYDVYGDGNATHLPYWTNNAGVLNGKPWMQFRGYGMLTNSTSAIATSNTTFALVYAGSIANGPAFWDAGASANRHMFTIESSGPFSMFAGSQVYYGNGAVGNWYWVDSRWNSGAYSSLSTNGVVVGVNKDCGNAAFNLITLGSRYSLDQRQLTGGIAEILVYDHNLSATDTQTVSNYFCQHYHVPAMIP